MAAKDRPVKIRRLSVERGSSTSREVRIVQKGLLWIAVPVEEGPVLDEATVETVRRKLRGQSLK